MIVFLLSGISFLISSAMCFLDNTKSHHWQVLIRLLAGTFAIVAGVSVAVATSVDDRDLFSGLQNPFLYILVPIGIFWLVRAKMMRNKKLTRCPDCLRHVSRSATSCPCCGMPLTRVVDN